MNYVDHELEHELINLDEHIVEIIRRSTSPGGGGLNTKEANALYVRLDSVDWLDLTDSGSTTLHTHDHGLLGGLGDDDHTQYHTDARALTWLGTRSTTDLPEGANLYYTDALARASISETVTGLDYNSTTGVLSLTSGYVIPTTTEESNWNTAYGWGNHATAGYLTTAAAATTYVPYSGATGNLDIGTHSLLLTGSIGATGGRVLKGWFTDLEVTNAISGSITGNAGTVTNGVYTTGADTVYLTPGTAASTYQPLVTWGDGLTATGATASVDFNTTNLKITAGQLNTIQNIATTSSPTFANLTDSGLTITRVPYASTSGLLVDSANMTFDTTNGLTLAAGSASALNLSSTAGTAVGGILFGADTNLYRSAANVLRTDDSFQAGGYFRVIGSGSPASGSGLGLEFGMSGGVGYIFPYNRTSPAYVPFNIYGNGLRFNPGAPTYGVSLGGAGGTTVASTFSLGASVKLAWEASDGVVDTNLYRSAADTAKTDDNFIVDLSLTVNGNTTLGNASTDTITLTGRAIFRTAASDPQHATPASRPAGSVGEICYYSGAWYGCTDAATPTWVKFTAT